MNNSTDSLTEFEGSVLAVVRRLGDCTPYQVRRAFEESPSREWSGSSGAVYPAIKRLLGRGFLAEERSAGDKRGTKKVSLTKTGSTVLVGWAVDIGMAISPGLDPFRARSPEWQVLSAPRRKAHMKKLERALNERIAELRAASRGENGEAQTMLELDLALQQSRLNWLRKQTKN